MKKSAQAQKAAPPVRRVKVVIQIEGAMVDKDTPVTAQSIRDYFDLHFQCPKGLKAHVLESEEVSP